MKFSDLKSKSCSSTQGFQFFLRTSLPWNSVNDVCEFSCIQHFKNSSNLIKCSLVFCFICFIFAGKLLRLLRHDLQDPFQRTIVFCNTTEACDFVGHFLVEKRIKFIRLHKVLPSKVINLLACDGQVSSKLTLYTLTSACMFPILFSIHFLLR